MVKTALRTTNKPSAQLVDGPLSCLDALHRLEPQGVGTSFCESAYSYVLRLAESQRVTLYQLVKFVCDARPGIFAEQLPMPLRLDSQCANSAEFISRLALLTQVPEVSFVGLAWLHGRVASNEKLKPGLAWCPICLRGSRELGQPVHGQSAWLFVNNRRCVLHDRPLRAACPRCGTKKDPRTIIKATPLDYCADCGCDLADEASYAVEPDRAWSAELAWDRYAARQVGELISRAKEIVRWEEIPDVERLCRSAVERGRVSSKRELAKLAGTDPGGGLPANAQGSLRSVDVLLRLSISADVSIAGVMSPELWAENYLDVPLGDAEGRRRTRRSRSHDWNAIRARVEAGLACEEELSIKGLSEELDVRQAPLLFKLGELGRSVTRHKQIRDSKRMQEEVDVLVERIRELGKSYSYFGRRLTAAEVCRNLGVTKDYSVLKLAWSQFEASSAPGNRNLSLFDD